MKQNGLEWLSIETAPKGKRVLIYDPTESKPMLFAWYGYEPSGDSLEKSWNDGYQTYYPTHWFPIPKSPKTKR